ncbi:MAG TPA: hypothetical protein VMZ06_16895 [Candidatus Bathyarchaeia archaeon]|nr:hypothetical protein [Candidatus Bathyarchaeia archaeon]
MARCGLILTLLLLGAAAFTEDTVGFTAENFLIVDGQPRLILGLYENPKDDAALAEAAGAGFNLVCGRPDQESLDRLSRHGVHAWIPLGGMMALAENDTAGREKLAAVINQFKDHPALLSWEAPDESLWNEYYSASGWIQAEQPRQLAERIGQTADPATAERQRAELARAVELTQRGLWPESEAAYDVLWKELGAEQPHPELRPTQRIEAAKELSAKLTRGWEYIWELDKRHALWQNHAPRNSIAHMREYNRAVHAAGCDIYPVPANYRTEHSDLRDKSLTSVGAYTDRMRDSAPGKACWMVLQGFGWRDIQEGARLKNDPLAGRRPNWLETRFMAYNSLLHGANAILYWGTAYIEKDSELWRNILRLARELRALEPAIVAPKPPFEPHAEGELNHTSFDGNQPTLMFRQYAGPDGAPECALIAVNEGYTGVAFRVSGLPAALDGRPLHRLYSDETVTVSNGGFRDGIRGYDVHVYATSKALQAE